MLVLPGLTTDDVVMAPLRTWLRARGWDPRGWDLGTNDGRPSLLEEVTTLVRATVAADGRTRLVGWSLGGTIARAVAERLADDVPHVVTIGSPVRPDAPRAADTPVTAIVSRRDGVVPYPGQLDDRDHVTTVEVGASHVGQLLSPDVWSVVAHALAEQSPGDR